MNCPVCKDAELTEEQSAGVSIDRCPSCHGIWLDALELEKLLEAEPKALLKDDRKFKAPKDDAGRRIKCPRCSGADLIKLSSLTRPGTVLDSCTVCYGMWLDAGELARLSHASLLDRLRGLFA